MDPKYKIDSKKAKMNLLEALKIIRCDEAFAQLTGYPNIQPNQCGALTSEYDYLKQQSMATWQCNISQIEVPITDAGMKDYCPTLLVGGEIFSVNGAITHSSFSLCVTFSSSPAKKAAGQPNTGSCCLASYHDKKRVVRRFHFDHQPNETNKPSDHLQFGGNFPGLGSAQTEPHYCIESVDNPRLHYLPMDFILLFDLAIRDFKTPLTSLIEEKSWRKLVVTSQNIWWSEYLDWLRATVTKKTQLHEIVYG